MQAKNEIFMGCGGEIKPVRPGAEVHGMGVSGLCLRLPPQYGLPYFGPTQTWSRKVSKAAFAQRSGLPNSCQTGCTAGKGGRQCVVSNAPKL
jgi:hypothetical protein